MECMASKEKCVLTCVGSGWQGNNITCPNQEDQSANLSDSKPFKLQQVHPGEFILHVYIYEVLPNLELKTKYVDRHF